jgi:type IV secretory pathway VirB2 component (pilin)
MNKAKRFVAAALAMPARASVAFHTAPDRLNDRATKLQVNAVACFAVVGAMLLTATPAAAQSSGGGGDITSFLQNLVNLITGTAGKLIAILAIAVTGILKMIGVASMRTLATVVFGCMLVFSAAWIVDQITGG